MFSWFKPKPKSEPKSELESGAGTVVESAPAPGLPAAAAGVAGDPEHAIEIKAPGPLESRAPAQIVPQNEEKAAHAAVGASSFYERLKSGLKRTGSSIGTLLVGARIDDALYEELESALLMADAGPAATARLLDDLKRRVKEARATEPQAVRRLLEDALAELLAPLERRLVIGAAQPTVLMTVGVNGAGKTTSIGKLARHFQHGGAKVVLAAGDTFRAAAREQLAVWADRNAVQIVASQGADPSAVIFDAVQSGRARGADVVIADTAGRLPTQLHLMDELKKIKRVVGKAMDGAPHEVLLVIDGNTGQNAIAQVKAFDAALGLTGLIVTKLDGSAKGGVLAAIACGHQGVRPVPVLFIGIGEQLDDLQPFAARPFARALLG
jgi:fused signal recognition particle receptor